MDPKLTEVSQLFERFKAAFVRNDFDTCTKLLSQLKVLLTGFKSLPPLFEKTPNAVHELTIARDIYEHAVVLSVKIEDQDAFERDFFQLKPYYTDSGDRLPKSTQEYPILGLNLLRLLVQNRIAEFHTELELLSATALENPCLKHAVELEQSFMEGAYNRVLSARQTAPHETYVYFMDLLAKTVRDEIAGCSEKAYDSLSVNDARQMLLFSSDQEVVEFIKEEHPEWEIKNGLVIFQRAKESAPCKEIPSLQLINQTLSYARELERIIKNTKRPAFAFMESETSSCSVSGPQKASNYDELFMQHSLLFADNLKDLKNLRKQLYSAAEYFELSYCKDDQKQLVVETLKDYVTEALISTVDHLGYVSHKVNNFLDEKVDEVSETKLRFSCIEQRLQTCRELIDYGGISQQSLAIKIPKYHKHYIIPVGDNTHAVGITKSVYQDHLHEFKNAAQKTMVEPHSSLIRKGHSKLPSSESSSSPLTFSFTRVAPNKEREKRAVSPYRFPLKHSGSLVRSISPNPSTAKQRYPSEPRRSVSLSTYAERDRTKEMEQYSKKSTRFFKALLSMRKAKNDGRVDRYMDN
ncbi:hypothetical protein F0562_035537 [Nyssa sinensis]|uniref:PCI domain-containing protein n=1 Tax=Nyssa sinensis TaxID=561372 RepID=A0A5J5AEB1_9ASTE|nr:hypothetical protein F0562_035537 [Nyssa sinensis]